MTKPSRWLVLKGESQGYLEGSAGIVRALFDIMAILEAQGADYRSDADTTPDAHQYLIKGVVLDVCGVADRIGKRDNRKQLRQALFELDL